MKKQSDRLITAKEVAALMQVSKQTVYRWAKQGIIKGVITLNNNVVRFSEQAVLEMITTNDDQKGA